MKTTGLGKYFPFYVTDEVRCSEDFPDQFRLFRVFDFGGAPAYVLSGPLSQECRLEPVVYRATV